MSIEFSSYNASGSSFADAGRIGQALESLLQMWIPRAEAAVTSATLCFKRLRFKFNETDDGDDDDDSENFDVNLGEVSLSPSGTKLIDVSVPTGVYRRIEFDLKDECGSDRSVLIVNSSGTFSTDEDVKIKFFGTFNALGAGQRVSMSTQAIINAMNSITSGSQIETQLESISGTFQ